MAANLEELPDIGEKPLNAVEVKFLNPIEGLTVAGYSVNLVKKEPVSRVVEALIEKMDVAPDAVHLASEGQDMDPSKTISENGITEPGPAAKKRGEKVQLVLAITSGAVVGVRKKAAEAEVDAAAKAEAAREAEARRLEAAALVADVERKKARLNMLPQEREAEEIKSESQQRYLRELRERISQRAAQAKLETESTAAPMAFPNMNSADIRRMLRVHVSDIDDRIAPRFDDTPTIEVIVMTYENGLPNYKGPLSDHLRMILRRSLSQIREADEASAPGVGRRRALCLRLADAFEACQAVQARVIEQLADELAEGPMFEREVRSMVVELKERNLDKTIMALFPDSAREAEAPGQAFAHMMNTYRQALGITRLNHEGTDRLAAGGGGDKMSSADRDKAMAMYVKQLDVLGLVDDMVRDINQPTGANERRIDRVGFAKWAGEHETIKHRVYFNEEDEPLYGGGRPLKNEEIDDTTQPFIHRALAIEILHMVIVQEAAQL